MKNHRRTAPVTALFLIVLIVAIPACGKKSSNSVTPPVTKELDSGSIASGGQYMHTFASAGTYNYHCAIHGTAMAGSVTVANGQAANTAVSIGNNFYNPTPASVAPGGTVTWTNNGVTHTVTSN